MISASVRRLAVFKAVAETGKFSEAASVLGIAQPSVSAHIKALERQAGQPLFVRSPGRAPRLTPAGEAVYGYAIDVVRRSEEMTSRLDALGGEHSVSVTVAAQRSLAHGMLGERLASFVHAHPQAKLVTRSETGERVLDLLRAQDVDLGVFLALGPIKGLASEVFEKEDLCLVAAPSHTLASRRSVSPVLLSEFGFIGGIAESHFAQMIGVVMRRLGVRRHRVVAEAQDAETVKELARHGAGLAWCLASSVSEEIRTGALVPVPLTRTIPALEVRWAAAPGRPLSAHALALVRHMKSKPSAKAR